MQIHSVLSRTLWESSPFVSILYTLREFIYPLPSWKLIMLILQQIIWLKIKRFFYLFIFSFSYSNVLNAIILEHLNRLLNIKNIHIYCIGRKMHVFSRSQKRTKNISLLDDKIILPFYDYIIIYKLQTNKSINC